MRHVNRRGFLQQTGAAVSASLLIGDTACSSGPSDNTTVAAVKPAAPALAGSVPLAMTIRGLCVLVLRKDGTVDVVLMNHEQRAGPVSSTNPVMIHPHAARLVASTDFIVDKSDGTDMSDPNGAASNVAPHVSWSLRGYAASITPGPSESFTEVSMTLPCDHPWQPITWLLDLAKAYPAGRLRQDLTKGAAVVAGVMQLKGGRLECTIPSEDIGSTAIWEITPFDPSTPKPKPWRQALSDQARYKAALPVGTKEVVINRTSLAGGNNPAPIRLKTVNAKGDPLVVTLDHGYYEEAAMGNTDTSALPHEVVFYDVFSNTLAEGPIPYQVEQVVENLPLALRTNSLAKVNNGDPYCNLCFVREV
jgi:hypothetical protein